MTATVRPTRGGTQPANVIEEIATRRRADVLVETDGLAPDALIRAARSAAPARPVVGRLAAPGLHLIAEIKRASPSAGRIAADQ